MAMDSRKTLEQYRRELQSRLYSRDKSNCDESARANLIDLAMCEDEFVLEEYERARVERANRRPGSLTGYDCEKCMNRGYFLKCENGYTLMEHCSCMDIRRSIEAAENSGLEGLLDRCTFETFEVDCRWRGEVKRMAESFAEAPSGWFYIAGTPGCGKTHLCTAICHRLIENGHKVRYILWRDVVERVKTTYSSDEGRYSVIEPLQEVEVLYIDDFLKERNGSAERVSDHDAMLAFEIITARYNSRLVTIFSSEVRADSLMQIDHAMGGRVWEMTNRGKRCINAFGNDKDYRLYGGQQA